ncbi:MAG: ATP-binding cassette domain-containing protein [Spirochaetota bacterium]
MIVRALQASIRIGYRRVLAPFSAELAAGATWLMTGPNGSGKSLAARLIAGFLKPHSGSVEWPALAEPARDIELVSFERVEQILAEERRRDMSSIMHGATDPGQNVRAFLRDGASRQVQKRIDENARRLNISHILDRGLRMLSTGELRKTMLARALARDPRLLIIDDPYDGLDAASQEELATAITEARRPDRTIVVVANRARDRNPSATHELELDSGRVVYAGRLRVGAAARSDRETSREAANEPGVVIAAHAASAHTAPERLPRKAEPLVAMRDVSVSYGATPILRSVDWHVVEGEHWMLYGPNGSGKSTLLSLITGDNPKAYGQEIELFGKRRGSGESVAEIKRNIGFVSGDLQLVFPLRTSVFDTVLSGFFDTIGLFDEPTGLQRRRAAAWLRRLGLEHKAEAKLKELSFGQRRLLLIARAVAKQPRLLIADEPCQGLDERHAASVLALLEKIAREKTSTLLYVTHNIEERLPSVSRIILLEPDLMYGSRAVTGVLENRAGWAT